VKVFRNIDLTLPPCRAADVRVALPYDTKKDQPQRRSRKDGYYFD
jgi:hypothetical protein